MRVRGPRAQRAHAFSCFFATRSKEYRGSRGKKRAAKLAAAVAAVDSRRGRMQGQRGEKKAAAGERRG